MFLLSSTTIHFSRSTISARALLNQKKIIGDIKKLKLKIQIKVQGEELRVDGKKRDDLQDAIAAIKTIDIGLPTEFINFRD